MRRMPRRGGCSGTSTMLSVFILLVAQLSLPYALASFHVPEDSVFGPQLGPMLAHYAQRHPPCSVRSVVNQPVDLSDVIWSTPNQQGQAGANDSLTISDGLHLSRECLINPTIAWLEDDTFVVVAKVLTRGHLFHNKDWVKVVPPRSPDQARGRCSAFSTTGPWLNQVWHSASDIMVIAVIRLDLQTGQPRELLARRVIRDTGKHPSGFIFDARLIRSDTGGLMLVKPSTIKRDIEPHVRLIPLKITRQALPDGISARGPYTIEPQAFRVFRYQGLQHRDKNLVPWHGTAKMSYPHHPSFEPHTVLDFSSYDTGREVREPASSTPVPVITAISQFFEAEGVRFGGGTPAVPFPAQPAFTSSPSITSSSSPGTAASDRDFEYLAVGHLVAHAQCFHFFSDAQVQAGRGRGAPFCPRGYLRQYTGSVITGLQSGPLNAFVPLHHREDYFMFFYTFSSRAPHNITRLSHAVIPQLPGMPHGGVFFPTGLEALGLGQGTKAAAAATTTADKYLLTFGLNDDSGMMLTLTRQEIEGMLRPVGELRPEKYEFCSMYGA